MEISDDKIERLIFVKFLLGQAERQKDLGRPIGSMAVLTMHDLVECFLQVCWEHLSIPKSPEKNNILDGYAEGINKQLAASDVMTISKPYIKRLNHARNGIKHSSVFVDSSTIDNLFLETSNFISDFLFTLFEIDIEDFSMADIVNNVQIKDFLKEAEKAQNSFQNHIAIFNIGKAFSIFQKVAMELKDNRGMSLIRSNSFRSDYLSSYRATFGGHKIDSNLKSSLENIAKDLNYVMDEIKVLQKSQILEVDLRRYLMFKNIMPSIIYYPESSVEGEHFYISREQTYSHENFNKEQVKFCSDFVFEAVLNFQSKNKSLSK